ncbi:MAG: hypothetical protein HKN43_08695 [Rhodothermales bacterium]|nr:hypothetical protein [Rhodothermales bacterium]
MQLILDKMAAAVVTAVVFLVLFGLQTRVQGDSIGETVSYMAKKQTLAFAEVLERDFANAGFMTAPGQDAILKYSNSTADSVEYTELIEFVGMGSNGSQAGIRYVTSQVDSTYSDGNVVPTFEVLRYENLGSGWKISGGSMSTLTDFDISLLDENNNGANMSNTRKIRIRLVNAVEIKRSTDRNFVNARIKDLRWGITLTPRGLSQQLYQG